MKIFSFFIMTLSFSARAFVPTQAYTFDFNVKLHSFDRGREEKLFESIEVIKIILSSEEFRSRILNHRYGGRKTFAHNNGHTNEQIYNKILEGMEKLEGQANNAMDVELELFTDMHSRVVGYTKPRSKKIWMNRKYFGAHSTAIKISSHLMHEWLHKLGFGHEKNYCQKRRYSVPYAVGYIIRDLAKEALLPRSGGSEYSHFDHWQSNDPKLQNSYL